MWCHRPGPKIFSANNFHHEMSNVENEFFIKLKIK